MTLKLVQLCVVNNVPGSAEFRCFLVQQRFGVFFLVHHGHRQMTSPPPPNPPFSVLHVWVYLDLGPALFFYP